MNPPLTLLQWKILRYLLREEPLMDKGDDSWRWFEFTCDRLSFCYCNGNKLVTAETTAAGRGLIKTPYVEAKTDEYRTSYHITAAGRAVFAAGEPLFTVPRPPPLRVIEREVLRCLVGYPDRWMAPLELGGRNGSQHSEAAYRLTLHGLAEMRKNGGDVVTGDAAYPRPQLFRRGKGSRKFRVTKAGIQLHSVLS